MKKLLFLLFIPLFLFSQEVIETVNTVDDKLNAQIAIAKDVVKNINEEKYLISRDSREYNKKITYLINKIDINKRQNNIYAVKRDQIKLLLLRHDKVYYNTLREIIRAKKSLKDKRYFDHLLKRNLKYLDKDTISKYTESYHIEKDNNNKIAQEFVKSYEDLERQNERQLFTLKYLLENMNEYRKTNFFIDKFNLQYFIKYIDTTPTISSVSQFTSYYFKFSLGEILVVTFIMLFFRIINTRIITLLTQFITISFTKHKSEESRADLKDYIKRSVERPLVIALYTLSVHISIYILVKDTQAINQITPWINTLYLGYFTWGIYALLNNSIANYAQHLVENYPNVRKEMIVFLLRITKIILVLIVLLFLLSQLGIDIKAIAASVGVGGIAIALASKDTLANFFGSLNIMTDNSFSQGDWIVTNEVEGTVVDIRMRTTRIRTFDNAMITIPNSQLANEHIKNYSKRKIGRRIKMMLGITYESKMSDIVALKDDIKDMLKNHPDIANEKNTTIRPSLKFEKIKREDLQGVKRTLLVYVDEYSDSSINILIYCFTRSPNWEEWLRVKEDVIVKISELAKKHNCEFAYPTQTLHLKH